MSVAITTEIRLWKKNHPERIFTGQDLRQRYAQLKSDEELLQALMLDNFKLCLNIDGQTVSRVTCMFNGETSPDLMYLYEQHLPALFQGEPAKIDFFEELVAWRFTPKGELMEWEVLDTSAGAGKEVVKQQGRCERLAFIAAALKWLSDISALMDLYQGDAKRAGGQDLSPQSEYAQRLLAYSQKTLGELGYK